MEVLIIILIYGAIFYGMYKLALSKNRNPWNWILPSFIFSPIIVIVILACCSSLPKKKFKKRKKK